MQYLVSASKLVKLEAGRGRKKMHTLFFAENESVVPWQCTKGFLELSFDKVPWERADVSGERAVGGCPQDDFLSPLPARAPLSKPVILA